MVKFAVSSDVDSSDDELDGIVEQTPLAVDWVKIDDTHRVGISSLPGCVCSGQRRSLRCDVDRLRRLRIDDSFVLCPFSELRSFKARNLLWELDEVGINVHHHPLNPVEDLDVRSCLKILDELERVVMSGKATIIHCLCGYGRSSVLVALLILRRNGHLTAESAIETVRNYRGPGAICTVRQYNFVKEFKQRTHEFFMSAAGGAVDAGVVSDLGARAAPLVGQPSVGGGSTAAAAATAAGFAV